MLLVYMIFVSSKTNEDSLSTIKFIPFTISKMSSSCCSSRTTPNIGPPQPKPFISNLTEDLPFCKSCFFKAFLVTSSKLIFIGQPPCTRQGYILVLLYVLIIIMSNKIQKYKI